MDLVQGETSGARLKGTPLIGGADL
jgi:hypothetical protein